MKRCFAILFLYTALWAAAPEVTKVDPPNWWAGHSINPIRLLIRGKELNGARVTSASQGVKAGSSRTNDAGTYLFVDISIAKNAVPGPVRMQLTTAGGSTVVPFEIMRPLARKDRFQGFSADDVMYLIMPDRFSNGDPSNDDPVVSRGLFDRGKSRYYHGGDLRGVMDHLSYLKDLGVTAIWLNPVYDNVNHLNEREKYDGLAITDYHGYGAVDFYGVDEHLGDVNTLRQLTDAAHAQGIKIVLDMVANHSGPYHPWATNSPTPTWFNGTVQHHLANTWQTWTLMDPHGTAESRKATLDGWFIDILPDLNQNDPEVARYLIQNTLWWVGVAGLDGIRQDTLPYVPRTFWREWMAAIKREYPNLRVVGEMFDGDPGLVSFFQGGKARFDGVDSGVDSLFDFPLFFALRKAFAQGGEIREVAKMLGHDSLYPNPNMLVTFAGLHDVERFMNEKQASADGLKLAFTLLLTTRGIPMIYYGDEIAMPGGGDPDNRRDFPGGWKDDSANAFTSAGRTGDQQIVFEHVRKLTAARRQYECLRQGTTTNLLTEPQVFAYARTLGRSTAIVVLNNEGKAFEAMIPTALANGTKLHDLFDAAVQAVVENGSIRAAVPARTGRVYVP